MFGTRSAFINSIDVPGIVSVPDSPLKPEDFTAAW